MIHVLEHWLGLTNASGKTYLWWSGFFGDVTIITAGLVVLRKLNCHTKGCWRLGRHHVEGTPYTTCRRHHPTVPNRVEHHHILSAHEEAKEKK